MNKKDKKEVLETLTKPEDTSDDIFEFAEEKKLKEKDQQIVALTEVWIPPALPLFSSFFWIWSTTRFLTALLMQIVDNLEKQGETYQEKISLLEKEIKDLSVKIRESIEQEQKEIFEKEKEMMSKSFQTM